MAPDLHVLTLLGSVSVTLPDDDFTIYEGDEAAVAFVRDIVGNTTNAAGMLLDPDTVGADDLLDLDVQGVHVTPSASMLMALRVAR